MKKTIFVSAADAHYFPMLAEWVASVRQFPQSAEADIGILNAGLTAEQADYFRAQGCVVCEPDWPAKLSDRKIRGKEFLKSCICRPFLPDYFPGYQTICWMDADIWVQDWAAVDLFLRGADRGALAIAPQADRTLAAQPSRRISWLGPIPWNPKGFYYSNARKAFSRKVARALFPYTTVNAGIFAMRADAPHWKRWQDLILTALKKGKPFTAEQMTLGILIHLEKYKVEFLPSWCNWRCSILPRWDEDTQKFVAPYLPHEPIGIMHLSGLDRERKDRSILNLVKNIDGKEIEKSLRYPYLDGESVLAPPYQATEKSGVAAI